MLVEGDASDLPVDFGEKFELAFGVFDDFAIVGAEDYGVVDFDWREEGGVYLENLL